jgi:hypothetical protein
MESIAWAGVLLAYLFRNPPLPGRTTFLTPPQLEIQVGFVVYPAGGEVAPHTHRSSEHRGVGTSEVLLVRQGRCLLDLYNDRRERVATRELLPGDLVLLVSGGHGIRMLEDTVLLELKRGPYGGPDDKVRFDPSDPDPAGGPAA